MWFVKLSWVGGARRAKLSKQLLSSAETPARLGRRKSTHPPHQKGPAKLFGQNLHKGIRQSCPAPKQSITHHLHLNEAQKGSHKPSSLLHTPSPSVGFARAGILCDSGKGGSRSENSSSSIQDGMGWISEVPTSPF